MAVTENYNVKVSIKGQAGLNKLNNSTLQIQKGLGGMTGAAKLAAGAIAAIGAGAALRSIVNTTARFEDLRTALSSVTGSAREGAEAFDFISEFSTKTQFGIEELSETFIKLKAAGIEPTQKLLTTFTDTAAVTTDQLGSLTAITDLFSRTTSGGLGLEELNRLADRGIPVFKILEERLGIARLEVSKFGQSAEGAAEILGALTDGLNDSFGGATEARVQNLSTRISNFQIATQNAADAVGQGLNEALGETIVAATALIENNKEIITQFGVGLGNSIAFVVENLTHFKNILIAILAVKVIFFLKAVAAGVTLVNGRVVILNATMKKNLLFFAASTVVFGLVSIAEKLGFIGDETDELTDSLEDNADAFDRTTTAMNDMQRSADLLVPAVTEVDEAIEVLDQDLLDLEDALLGPQLGKAFDMFDLGEKEATSMAKAIESLTFEFDGFGFAADTVNGIMDTFAKGTGDAFADAIVDGKSLRDSMEALGKTILKSVISALVQIAIQYFIVKPLMERLGLTLNPLIDQEKKITRELGKQVGLRLILALLTGGTSTAIPGMARGGPVAGGSPYIVGEQGPELFVPNNSGTIVPNDQIGGAGGAGGGEVNINFNISTIDAAGFDDLLLARRGVISGIINEGMNRQGRRALV